MFYPDVSPNVQVFILHKSWYLFICILFQIRIMSRGVLKSLTGIIYNLYREDKKIKTKNKKNQYIMIIRPYIRRLERFLQQRFNKKLNISLLEQKM